MHAGGRGKAGGIKVVDSPEEARREAEQILGLTIKGLPVEKVLVEQAVTMLAEYYLGITLDRDAQRNVVMISAMGGVDIEEVAATNPAAIARAHVDPSLGLCEFQIRQALYEAGVDRAADPGSRRSSSASCTTPTSRWTARWPRSTRWRWSETGS